MSASPGLHWLRNDAGRAAAIVFVHGFSGDCDATWGRFPALLLGQKALSDWDVALFSYSSRPWIDLPRLWASDAPVERIAMMLRTEAERGGLRPYRAIAFIAHSMGGLVCQRAILDSSDLAVRTSNLILFGTPSEGLNKARPVFWAKRQLAALAAKGPFITDLRKRWAESPGDRRVGRLVVVSGERDEFVNQGSAQNPFCDKVRAAVPGHHVSLVKPDTVKHPSVELVRWELTKGALAGQDGGAATAALQRNTMREHVNTWLSQAEGIDNPTLVRLALALEVLEDQDQAVAILKRRVARSPDPDTDVLGALAGRLKRRWQKGRLEADGRRALEIYQDALTRAQTGDQAFYQAINVAFMQLVFAGDRAAAEAAARTALSHCDAAPEGYWKLATIAEAYLILRKDEDSLEHYKRAVVRQTMEPASDSQRQLMSTRDQALAIAETHGTLGLKQRLLALFGEIAE